MFSQIKRPTNLWSKHDYIRRLVCCWLFVSVKYFRLILVALGKCHVLIWPAFIFIFWDHCWLLIRKWCIPSMYLYLFFIFMIKVVFIWRFRVIGSKETDQLLLESCFPTVIYRTRGLFRQNWGCRYYRYRHDPDVVFGKLHASLEFHHIEYFTSHVTQCFYLPLRFYKYRV